MVCMTVSMTAQTSTTFSQAEVKEDFTLLKQALTEAHPGMYRFTSKKNFDFNFKSLENQLNDGMTEIEFFRLLNPLLAQIKCGHTKWHRQGKPDDLYAFSSQNLFPLQLYFTKTKVHVLDSYGDQPKIEIGSQVISINGIRIENIKAILFANIFADGNVQSVKYQELNKSFPGYYASFVGSAPVYTVVYKSKSGNKREVAQIPAVGLEEIVRKEQQEILNPFQLSFPEKDVALMRIAEFVPGKNGPDYENFLETSFNEIARKNVGHLILDLRNNQGGIDAWGKKLYAYLTDEPFRYYDKLLVTTDRPFSFAAYAILPPQLDQLRGFIEKFGSEYRFTYSENLGLQKPQNISFLGEVYVVMNGMSYSVTAEFASISRDNDRAVFFGEECGGASVGNNSGAHAIVTLPHTRLTLGIPLVAYYLHLKNPQKLDRGVLPDYHVVPTVVDLLTNKDIALEKAMQLVQQRKSGKKARKYASR